LIIAHHSSLIAVSSFPPPSSVLTHRSSLSTFHLPYGARLDLPALIILSLVMPGAPVSGLLRNTLTSPPVIEKILSLPRHEELYGTLSEIVARFQKTKNLASEVQTELLLVKPILKLLGYAFDSKPKVLEEQVKDPDFALFASDGDRAKSSSTWGSKEYYENVLAILAVKRYGRNLEEGISGFYLEFETRIPIFQIMYLVRTLKVPWGILTNGKRWILLKRPIAFEKQIVEIDLEQSALNADIDSLHLFFHAFSSAGLSETIPRLLEEERTGLVNFIREKRGSVGSSLGAARKKADIYPRIISLCKEFFPARKFPLTDLYLNRQDGDDQEGPKTASGPLNEYNEAELFTYLLAKAEAPPLLSLEDVLLNEKRRACTKEEFLSLKILDMTPGCGALAVQLVDALTYLALTFPYKEKNTFVAEWEGELTLNRYILDNILHGIERFHPSLDILQNALSRRFHNHAGNYRLGNPLLGMSLQDLQTLFEEKKQTGLFTRHPREVLDDFRAMYQSCFSLSRRIREDAILKDELEGKLSVYRERVRDVMDLLTATYFSKKYENKRIRELLFSIEGDEAQWQVTRRTEWFREAKGLAARNSFFHMEMEFPFLLNSRFDVIIIQPGLRYIWEDSVPVADLSRAYIKRASAYLKQDGKIVLVPREAADELLPELKKSKKYDVKPAEQFMILRRK
jgi:hypothetical protein